jgi:hypothetical protein
VNPSLHYSFVHLQTPQLAALLQMFNYFYFVTYIKVLLRSMLICLFWRSS